MTPKRALAVGIGQCSRRLFLRRTTLDAYDCRRSVAACRLRPWLTFSFLLGLPTLGAACLFEAFKSRHVLFAGSLAPLAIGLVVSFLVAWAVVALFIRYLQKRGLEPFGYYRIALGLAVLLLLR